LFCYKCLTVCGCLTAAYPDAPQNLEVTSETWESIELRWTPGFDGGYEQQFVVVIVPSTRQGPVYRQAGSASTFNVTGCALLIKHVFVWNLFKPGIFCLSVYVNITNVCTAEEYSMLQN